MLEGLARIDLQVTVVASPDARRLAARDRARDAAIVAGRLELFDDAAEAARELAIQAFSEAGYSGSWAMTRTSVSVARAVDRVAAAAAFEEAAMAAVTEDLVDDATTEELRWTGDVLAEMTGLPSPGSISAVGSPGARVAGPIALALVAGFAFVLFATGFAAAALTSVALAVALAVGLRRRRRQPDP